jgi:hypothetical protein
MIYSINDLVAMARNFMNDCANVSRSHLLSARDIEATRNLFETIHSMMLSINLTSDSILLLLSNNRTWDASILLRSVIEGTARLCYMLVSPSPDEENARINEFRELLPKKEVGSLEQRIAKIMKGAFYRGKGDVCFDPLKKIVDEQKTKDGEGAQIREVSKKWEFWNITKALRNEYALWSEMADWWEYRYAMSNSLVHKTDTGCGEIAERADRDTVYREISNLSHAASLLIDDCMLFYTRCKILVKRIKGEEVILADVLMKNKCLFDSAEEIQRMFEKAYRKAEYGLCDEK